MDRLSDGRLLQSLVERSCVRRFARDDGVDGDGWYWECAAVEADAGGGGNSRFRFLPALVDRHGTDRRLQGDAGTGSFTAETFPVVFSILLLSASLLFSVFVFVYPYRTSRRRSSQNRTGDGQSQEASTEESHTKRRSSWTGSHAGDAPPARQQSSFLEAIEEAANDADIRSGENVDGTVDSDQQKGVVMDDAAAADPRDEEDALPPALLSWRGVSCSYKAKSSRRSQQQSADEIQTLYNAHGVLRSTELVAIMGPSGGGKSTLLDILSGRKSLGTITGEFSILGQHSDAKSGIIQANNILQNVSAYVPQQEQFFPTQTPEEAVAFFANLKLGRDPRGDDVRRSRIEGLLDMVGLTDTVRKRPIGGVLAGGITIRGLSGGERKRLALACAVAMKPKILFLDEITSGLDSENAVIVISLLKKMCRSLKVAAAVVIHQPSIDLFEQFDRMVLLSEGRCIYSDRLVHLPAFYRNIVQETMPSNYLVPNDLLRLASNWDNKREKRTSDSRDSMTTQTFAASFRQDASTASSVSVLGITEQGLPKTLPMPVVRPPTPSQWKFSVVFIRNLQNHYVRNLTNLAARLVIYGSTSLLLGMIFWGVNDADGASTVSLDQSGIVLGAGLFLSQKSFLLPFGQISTFFFDKKVFASESALRLYPSWMYAVSQFILEAWVLILASLVEAIIVTPMMSLWNPAMDRSESFFTLLTFFAINGLTGNSMVLFISMLSFSQDVAFLTSAAIVVIALATSGGFVPFAAIPAWISWLQWISPIKYSLQTFVMSVFDGTGSVVVEYLDLDVPSTITGNVLAMMGMFGVMSVGTVAVLSLQKEVR